MCLRVDASGYTDQINTFISIHLYVKDHRDITDHLEEKCFELLNQYSGNIHHQQTIMVVNNPHMNLLIQIL